MTRIKPTLTKSDLYSIINEEVRRAIAELRIGSTSPIAKHPPTTRGDRDRGPTWPAWLERATTNNIKYMGTTKEKEGRLGLAKIARQALSNAEKRSIAKKTNIKEEGGMERAPYEEVEEAMWNFFEREGFKAAADEEAKTREVEKYGWSWEEYMQRSIEELEAHERRISTILDMPNLQEEESPESDVDSDELVLNAFQELLASDAVQEEILNMLQGKLNDASDSSSDFLTPSALSEAPIGCGSKKKYDKRKLRRK